MIPANSILSKGDRVHIKQTRTNRYRVISIAERVAILASLEEYKDAGSEDSKMILASVSDMLGLYDS